MDANGAENSFEDWCSEIGYETDSRQAEAVYKLCKETAQNLKGLLGTEGYEKLLYHTERM
jgi:hypothetical protein